MGTKVFNSVTMEDEAELYHQRPACCMGLAFALGATEPGMMTPGWQRPGVKGPRRPSSQRKGAFRELPKWEQLHNSLNCVSQKRMLTMWGQGGQELRERLVSTARADPGL